MLSYTYRSLYITGKRMLEDSGIDSPAFTAKLLLAYVMNVEPSQIMIRTEEVSAESSEEYFILIKRRICGEPLQYLLGKWEFYSLEFKVVPGVLIPRPETELLVDKVLALAKTLDHDQLEIADLCTGSGCIAAAVAHNLPQANVIAADFFPAPLEISHYNFKHLGLENAKAVRADVLSGPPSALKSHFDILISNPPYIENGEMNRLQWEVRFEPPQALNGGEDGLDFYRAICEKWAVTLKNEGYLALEIGFNQAQQVKEICEKFSFENIKIYQDLSGLDRVVTAQKMNRKEDK